MNSVLRVFTKCDNFLARGEAVVLVFLASTMTVVVFLQVVFRYALAQPLHWSEEIARYLFVWLSILGATLGLQQGGHFGLDLFYRMLPQRGKRVMRPVTQLLMGMVILVILVQGITLVQKTALQESPAMGISMGWAYAALPAGAGLMAIHLLVIFLRDAAGSTKSQAPNNK